MASAQDVQKLRANLAITQYDFDPDVDTPVDVGWIDMRDKDGLLIIATRTVGTGALTGFSILANTASDGTGTDVTVKSHAVASEPDAFLDFVVLEISAAEIASEAAIAGVTGARYVSANLELASATDEFLVTYIASAKVAQLDLTSDSIA